ncbi:MAG TPA: SRPBCC family protein [Acidimicrobiia bacterium]|jgi:uncharacterized protein YndB with AHSA1/START domain|nr:SRPBCC family protein [Acidimicrobiia bacterium]
MSESRDVVSVERVIAAPAEKIFDLLADPDRHHDIDGSGSVRDAKKNPERLAMGSEFGMAMHLGVNYSTTNEIIEFDDGKRIAWQTRPAGSIPGRFFGGRIWRYELEPADGGTLVRESWDISREKGPIKGVLRTGRSKDHTRGAMEKTLGNIAQLVE